MKASLLDRSLYFKGLLILIRQDRAIREPEKKLMLRIGASMGFEKKFCRNNINEIMNNKNIDDSAPVFTRPEIARFFIHDGLIISAVDKDIHENELVWLKKVAAANGIEQSYVDDYLKKCAKQTADDLEKNLKVKEIAWA
ncbi:MAG TPA: hypothetical protein P5294_05775 [Smithellaceae bacterium]|nr:hypothetical protein [Smithellaceae bacterium]HRS90015.1 hypothetical protein [Smithellaceae bacterium]HRV26024.1 hypothetical protein [Smithellaceae bacterium]